MNFADNDLKLKEVYLWVKKENIAAIRVYEKCGFIGSEEEGRLKNEIYVLNKKLSNIQKIKINVNNK